MSLNNLPRIFETINKTGVALNIFDLLVARIGVFDLAIGGHEVRRVSLRSLIMGDTKRNLLPCIRPDLLSAFDDERNLGGTATRQLARLFGLVFVNPKDHKDDPTMKESKILQADPAVLRSSSVQNLGALEWALDLLKNRAGCPTDNFVPFRDAINLLGAMHIKRAEAHDDHIMAFYWTVVFTVSFEQQTGEAVLGAFKDWLKFRQEPYKADYLKDRLDRTKGGFPDFESFLASESHVHSRGVLAFMLAHSKTDWAGKELTKERKLENHHILPSAWCDANFDFPTFAGEDIKELKNCALNRVYISKDANRNSDDGAGANLPANYLKKFMKAHPSDARAMCLPERWAQSLEVPLKKDDYLQLLRVRYDLIKDSVTAEIARLASAKA